jgi:hypothetical protein
MMPQITLQKRSASIFNKFRRYSEQLAARVIESFSDLQQRMFTAININKARPFVIL